LNISEAAKTIIQLALLLMGEYPIDTVHVGQLLFDGYDDQLLSVANSELLKALGDIFNNGTFS
jgi:hypothetical protein